MDYMQLQAVIALSEELHFVNAARRLGMSQPALSQKIQRIEAEIGTSLFNRNQRGVAMTDAGRIFVAEARTVLTDFERAVTTARRVARGEIGRLRIGFVENASFHLLPRAVSRFRKSHPDVGIELTEMISFDLGEALVKDRIDLALMRPIVHDLPIDSRMVFQEPYKVALPENHPLADKDTVRISDLADLPFIVAAGQKAQYLKERFRPLFTKYGFDLKVGQEVSQLIAIIGLVGAGLGYTLLPVSATGLSVSGVIYRQLDEPDAPMAELMISWREGTSSPLVGAFLKHCYL